MSELKKVNYNGTIYDIGGGSGGINPVIVQDGVTYTLVVDPNTGDIIAVPEGEEEYHIVTDGLIAHYRVVDGVVTDLVSGTTYPDVTVYTSDDSMNNSFWKSGFELISGVKTATIDYVAPRLYTGTSSGTGIRPILLTVSGVGTGRLGCTCESANADPTSNNFVQNSIYKLYYQNPSGSGMVTVMDGSSTYTYNFADSHQATKLCYFDTGNFKSYPANSEKCTCAIVIDAEEREDSVKNKAVAINGIYFPNKNTDSLFPDSEFSATMYTNNSGRLKEIRVYDRVLTEDELIQNAKADGTYYKTLTSFVIGKSLDGYTHFGANYAIGGTDSIIPNMVLDSEVDEGTYTDDFGNEYTVSDFTAYAEPSRTESVFEGIGFIYKPETLYTFRKYSVVAYPYPFIGSFIGENEGKFHIMYTSSDEDVCACVDGVLIPKTPGTVTITARLAGSQLTDSFTATVAEFDNSVSDAETTYVSRKYVYDFHPLLGGSATDTTIAMFQAIQQAADEGFKKIVFPKAEYHVYPVFMAENANRCFIIPSNLIIDFNYSTLYMDENPYMYTDSTRQYQFFVFLDTENSSIENLTIYGERRNNTTHAESEYTSASSLIEFVNAYKCGTKNVRLYDTVGFAYWYSEDQQYHYWDGIRDPNWSAGSGLANRGRMVAEDWELGDYDSNGDKITDANHIRLKAKTALGYDPEDLETFLFGFMGVRYYIIPSRWVRVWWYDANDNLLNQGGTLYFQYSKYHLPTGAVSFKLSAYGSTLPTQNYGEDMCVLRLYPYRSPNECYTLNLLSKNPGGWALTVTGGQNNYIGNAVLDRARKWNYYSIDHENEFITTQSFVYDKIIGVGLNLYGGHGHAVLSNNMNGSYRSIHILNENESCRVMNCVTKALYKTSKTDCVYRGIKYASTNSDTPLGSLIETDMEVISNFNIV